MIPIAYEGKTLMGSSPAPRWGGGEIFSTTQKRQQISTRNFQFLLQHKFGVYHKILEKFADFFLRKLPLSDVTSDFCYFFILIPKTQNFIFSKINAYKIQHFGIIKKPESML